MHLKPIIASKTNANKFGGVRVYENCLGASNTNLIRIWRLIDQFYVSDYENGFGCIQKNPRINYISSYKNRS